MKKLSSFIYLLQSFLYFLKKINREADVLQLFALVLEKVNLNLEELVPKILELIFSSTLTMITRDFQSYPDHRLNFFTFLRAVISYAFECIIL